MASISKKIVLKSCDGKVFEVEETVAVQSKMIKNMIEDDCVNEKIPLPDITGEILSEIIEYCKMHVDGESNFNDKLKAWDADFITSVDLNTLYYLIVDSFSIFFLIFFNGSAIAIVNNKKKLNCRLLTF
ncbi:hypothetical protein V6N13_021114 [Hibiscus sabdariffa]|uniref:SKP1 component POZ domain-containing protein n=1 Tax=Hibiscus sabdariffa TaxID=183260 RepID=A0ABR2EVH5_9ROSI